MRLRRKLFVSLMAICLLGSRTTAYAAMDSVELNTELEEVEIISPVFTSFETDGRHLPTESLLDYDEREGEIQNRSGDQYESNDSIHRKVDIQCEDFVEKLASIESFHVKSPEYKDKVAYFYTGFETLELWNAIVNSFMYSGKYLWIYGRKNMKLVLHHEQLFQFLDPASDEVQRAHKDQDIFPSELMSTIKRARHLIGDNTRFQQCFRKYSHKREEVIIRLDNCIIYSKPQFDKNGYPPIMTNSMFQIFGASSPQGKITCQKFEHIWANAAPMY